MLHAAIWITAAIALALWSAAAWLLVESAQRGQAWIERLGEWLARGPYRSRFDDWLPGWQELLRSVAALMQTLLDAVGAVAPWWPWALWAAGALLVLLVASTMSLVVVLLTTARGAAARSAPRSGPSSR